jgi:hypothetical protein
MAAFFNANSKTLLFLLIGMAFFADAGHAEHRDSHKDLRDPAKCMECHTEKPEVPPGEICTGKITAPIKDDVTNLCTKCHEYGERSHPTDVLVDFAVPSDLPLKDNNVTCVTCHYPHNACESEHRYISSSLFGGFFSKGKKHKTYFLRRTNANGELCLACHK